MPKIDEKCLKVIFTNSFPDNCAQSFKVFSLKVFNVLRKTDIKLKACCFFNYVFIVLSLASAFRPSSTATQSKIAGTDPMNSIACNAIPRLKLCAIRGPSVFPAA